MGKIRRKMRKQEQFGNNGGDEPAREIDSNVMVA